MDLDAFGLGMVTGSFIASAIFLVAIKWILDDEDE